MHVDKLDHRQEQDPRLATARRGGPGVEMVQSAARSKALAVLTCVLGLVAAAPAESCRLSVLGDSLASGYGVGEDDAFPVRLEQALAERGVACTVLNAGVSGDTSAGGLARLEWVLGDQPTHLLVELGGNDALRGLAVEQLRVNLNQIVSTAQARGVEVVLAGMLAPPNLGRSYGDAFRQVYLDVATAHDVPLYPFFLDGAVLTDGMMQPDGIHPNARGVQVIVDRIAPLLATAIQDD
jgi:acyl-CoA thioesterase-1